MTDQTPARPGDAWLCPLATGLNWLFRIFMYLFLVLTVALVFIVSTDVVLRWFGHGVIWADEMSRMLIIWIAFIAMALGVEVRSHVEITMFFGWFPKGFQRVWMAVNRLITMAIGLFITVFGAQLVGIAAKGKLEIVRQLPKSVLYITIPIGGFFIAYFSLLQLLGRDDLLPSSIRNFYPGSKEDVKA